MEWVVSATLRPFYRREKEASWASGPVWTRSYNLSPQGIDPWTVHTVTVYTYNVMQS
jgi:hypothetical protein